MSSHRPGAESPGSLSNDPLNIAYDLFEQVLQCDNPAVPHIVEHDRQMLTSGAEALEQLTDSAVLGM